MTAFGHLHATRLTKNKWQACDENCIDIGPSSLTPKTAIETKVHYSMFLPVTTDSFHPSVLMVH
jgi:hypothetical protein